MSHAIDADAMADMLKITHCCLPPRCRYLFLSPLFHTLLRHADYFDAAATPRPMLTPRHYADVTARHRRDDDASAILRRYFMLRAAFTFL